MRRLALVTIAIAMVGCGLSVVGSDTNSSGGPGDGGREGSSNDVTNDPPDPPFDGASCDGAPTCAAADLVVLAQDQVVRAVAVSGDSLYFINQTARTIVRTGLDGSNPTDVLTTAEPARQLTVDGEHIWYTGPDLHHVSASGGGDLVLQTGVSGCVFVDPDKTVVYAADFDSNRILSLPYVGGPRSDFLTADAGVAFPWGVAATAADIYFTTSGTRPGIIYKRSKTGTTNEVVKEAQANPNCLAFDEAGSLYWVNNSDGSIHRSKADGSDEVVLVANETNITQVAVDEKYVYWGSQNKVKRLAR